MRSFACSFDYTQETAQDDKPCYKGTHPSTFKETVFVTSSDSPWRIVSRKEWDGQYLRHAELVSASHDLIKLVVESFARPSTALRAQYPQHL
ncbi:hypothetical protein PP180_06035 [Muricauda sp. SK9]|uniref:hypothetical protein n=1 Tax=Flavobacteriaceae TaxID=49546 RepID=UPI00234AA585|nr:hypothetical protein [Muricauda sp. SK9]MDC6384916.1 hypothetical protein [Muricauda sp. SK9]